MQAPDISTLRALIAADSAARGETVSRLGYFCAPFRPATGPYAECVIKVYRALHPGPLLDRLAGAHDAYVSVLRDAGVRLPETSFHLVPDGARRVPVIVQAALPAETMLRARMLGAARAEALELVETALGAIAAFWAHGPWPQRVGFHPSIRNYAVDGEGLVFLDTFPPLIGYDRAEMGRLLLTFSGNPAMRLVGPLLPGVIRSIQDEWYSAAGTLTGLVGSAVRLRPQDGPEILALGRRFAQSRLSGETRAAVLAELDRPPRLPAYWTATRRALGLEGADNVR